MACAAAWLTCARAESAAVIVFLSETECIVAHGFRDDSHEIEVSVGQERKSVLSLLDDHSILALASRVGIDRPDFLLRMPDRLAAVAVSFSGNESDSNQDELTALVTSVTQRILASTTQRQCLFAEPRHMEAMAEFSAGAGHEINNPLGSIIGQTQLLLKKTDGADYREALETIGAQAWRIRDMIGDSMLFARPPVPQFQRSDVCEIVKEASDQVRTNHGLQDGELRLELPASPIMANVDVHQVSVLTSHLLRNSVVATEGVEPGRRITVALNSGDQHAFRLTVDDNGSGVTDDKTRRHLFDPFYSGRQAGRGLGFGLCLCWQIVRRHHGLLLQQNLERQGCRFLAGIPLSSR
ncbi:MAG: HAMP domain-containing sensor histidine kinase [Planctomycetaceae bacterium]